MKNDPFSHGAEAELFEAELFEAADGDMDPAAGGFIGPEPFFSDGRNQCWMVVARSGRQDSDFTLQSTDLVVERKDANGRPAWRCRLAADIDSRSIYRRGSGNTLRDGVAVLRRVRRRWIALPSFEGEAEGAASLRHRPRRRTAAAEIREADLFYADLMGSSRTMPRTRGGLAVSSAPRRPALREAVDEQAEVFEDTPAPFQVRLTDPQDITAQARESKYRWAGDRVQLELVGGGVKTVSQVSANGLFEIPAETATGATISVVSRVGTYRSMVRWRTVAGGPPAVLRPGTPHAVEISSRLRLSIWTFTPPFTSKVTPGTVELDSAQVQLLKDADVDDVSLVYTIAWDTRAKPSDPAKPPKWHDFFTPAGQTSEALRTNYLKGLVAALHPRVQVIAGFELVRGTPSDAQKKADRKDAALGASAADFANWLAGASPDDIKKYAQSINTFFESRGIDVDGIGYDFEFDQLTLRHKDNLALLYRETSRAVAHHNGLVSYANAPFKEDGVNSYGFMKVQPFALAATAPNLLARPMCFDAVNSTSVPNIEASIACALRDPGDTANRGGAGLHPSQVQFGIWADKVQGGLEDLCRRVLRPNRIGVIVYNLPGSAAGAGAMLRKCKTWNSLLNPGEGPAGQDAQPLQVPRGFGGWPPPFRGSGP
jgi:hypothetical protein